MTPDTGQTQPRAAALRTSAAARSTLFSTGKPIVIRSARQASQRARDSFRVATGINRERMRRRAARRAGVSFKEYERRRKIQEEERLERQEAAYAWAERQAKRRDRSEEEKRAEFNEYMRRKYWVNPENWSTRKKRRKIFERDNWRCRICGKVVSDKVHRNAKNRAVAGHIVARATGGQWTDENMCTLCFPCNCKDGVNQLPIQLTLGSFGAKTP